MAGIQVKSNGQVLEIVLDRPKANAIDSEASLELNRVFTEFNRDAHHRVAILTGAGSKFFCTGGDLKELDAKQGDVDYGKNGFAGLTHFTGLEKPVIAAVNGLCVGGGLELLLACDLVVSSSEARFFLSETLIGNVPFLVSVQRLLHRLPRNIALEMLYTGRQMTASELASYGLINAVVPADQLRSAAYELAEKVIAAAPLAISACKRASAVVEAMSVKQVADFDDAESLEFFDEVMRSEDAKEGARAFVEKRAPVWRGL
ncbi:enoyl-CoA hydratase/isomerase family protein [Pseudomonas sp. LPB0260]|uniref:enoyl-CoA hydratase-related protein n=1 Tax=Pseudomonas sp. LPB0260 TaxID=2614442 RepID=UPI0015C222B8|nr:enoyl-CoA hydratase-related protein [Pseudomonas sp. LPB0260]QLC74785.1 enoyl-CoA hydratase/isomerase family protein [Pseudomonas sp. LPB0260]